MADAEQVPLPDVTKMSLRELRASKDTALARALRQVLTQVNDPNGVISAFQSFASD